MNSGIGEVLRRYEKNPILTARDWPYPANSVFNPGAALLPGGETLLLARVEDRRGISHLTAARRADGLTGRDEPGRRVTMLAPGGSSGTRPRRLAARRREARA